MRETVDDLNISTKFAEGTERSSQPKLRTSVYKIRLGVGMLVLA